MKIREQVQEIIDSRRGQGKYDGKGRLAMIQQNLDFVESIETEVNGFDLFLNQIKREIQQDNGRFADLVEKQPQFVNRLSEIRLDDLKQNKLYDITPEMIAELNEDKENKTAENKELMDLRDENYYGGKYSVLYAHGDFKINGKIYKNYIAEVLAGKYLIRFEENPLWICPFILCALEYDPLTKRGISPLKSIMSMCKEEERLTNTAFDVQKLTANPCYWANEDLFDATNTDKDGNVRKVPGKVLKFKNDLAGSLPIPIEVSANGISDLLGFLNNRISEVSSVSDVLIRDIERFD